MPAQFLAGFFLQAQADQNFALVRMRGIGENYFVFVERGEFMV